jgi:beta-lactamase regulating signal transducer with metallopeptidase domain
MEFINEIFSKTLIYSVGWTIVHSLWQSAVITLITIFVLWFLKKQSSNIRYLILSAALFSILLLAAWSFIQFYNFYDHYYSIFDARFTDDSEGFYYDIGFDFILFKLLPENVLLLISSLNSHVRIIFAVWIVGVLFLAVKYLGAYSYSQRLRYYGIFEVEVEWQKKFEALLRKVNLNLPVKLLESKLVKVPVVIGFLKPVILFPIGLLAGLPVEQVEAILTHEIAHIKRRDYLVNILQSSVEIILFFNPFVWWLSSKIKTERENCCDEITVSVTENTAAYVKALSGIGEFTSNKSNYALTLSSNKHYLLKRIERIIEMKNVKNSTSRFLTALTVLVITIFIVGAASFDNVKGEKNTKVFVEPDSTKSKKNIKSGKPILKEKQMSDAEKEKLLRQHQMDKKKKEEYLKQKQLEKSKKKDNYLKQKELEEIKKKEEYLKKKQLEETKKKEHLKKMEKKKKQEELKKSKNQK